MQKVLDKWAFSPRISIRGNNEMERFVQFPPKGYGVLAYHLKAFEDRPAAEETSVLVGPPPLKVSKPPPATE